MYFILSFMIYLVKIVDMVLILMVFATAVQSFVAAVKWKIQSFFTSRWSISFV